MRGLMYMQPVLARGSPVEFSLCTPTVIDKQKEVINALRGTAEVLEILTLIDGPHGSTKPNGSEYK